MIARIGHTELKAMLRYKMQMEAHPVGNIWRYVTSRRDAFWWDEDIRWEMQFSSGFFPCTDDMLARFCERYFHDLEQADMLGSWLPQESELEEHIAAAVRVPLQDLEPFAHRDPWTMALEGCTVLVVHPFETSIRRQYERRASLFADRRFLPDFELKTLKAVQSLGGHAEEFENWFDALDAMCERMSRISFDVAIIGAGAYGLPLAAQAKRLGRKALHLGGASQLLFGIRGKRWEERELYRSLMNESWVRPLPEETPSGHHHVDQGRSYW